MGFKFQKHTFVYGEQLDTYPVEVFENQIESGLVSVSVKDRLKDDIFQELRKCLKNSSCVKRKFQRML